MDTPSDYVVRGRMRPWCRRITLWNLFPADSARSVLARILSCWPQALSGGGGVAGLCVQTRRAPWGPSLLKDQWGGGWGDPQPQAAPILAQSPPSPVPSSRDLGARGLDAAASPGPPVPEPALSPGSRRFLPGWLTGLKKATPKGSGIGDKCSDLWNPEKLALC